MAQDEWLERRITYISGLKAPSGQQKMLLMLSQKESKSADDDRKIAAIARAEKSMERALKARAGAARIVNAEKVAERKVRDREMYQAAGLMSLAGLLTPQGTPVMDKGELVGALMSLAKVANDDPRRKDWKRVGDAALAKK